MPVPDSTGPSGATPRPVRAIELLAWSCREVRRPLGEQQRRLVAADVAGADDAEADGDRLAGGEGRRRIGGHARARSPGAGRCLGRGGSVSGTSRAAAPRTPS